MDFAQAVTGVQKTLQYERLLLCKTCNGQRVKQKSEEVLCPQCKGSGEGKNADSLCNKCLGTGLLSVECESCKGDGITMRDTKVQVKIPKGVDDEMLLRVRDRGHQALNGKAGDLILTINLHKHANFTRDAYDILSDVNITVTQAIMGGTCNVDTIHGSKQLKI